MPENYIKIEVSYYNQFDNLVRITKRYQSTSKTDSKVIKLFENRIAKMLINHDGETDYNLVIEYNSQTLYTVEELINYIILNK